ncbi:hypothetical protein PanWU01x14_175680 [Parasponia andersonii]|uniref:Uncharacterized protein n=1 Tax=Parasponia andersonii TaxID=3476 RepID=A0A2P5C829_PARAD|nr:hypothetical protein PanWU01x14_175680 [Parasponia andersonii]
MPSIKLFETQSHPLSGFSYRQALLNEPKLATPPLVPPSRTYSLPNGHSNSFMNWVFLGGRGESGCR